MEIKIHSEVPKIIGFHPADLILSIDNPAPIKKSVNTKRDLETWVIPDVTIAGIGK